ncbi:MAG: RNA methyltransferase [Firmicutes bacterium]|nr:RNA methyltransferase [Bacillota bacterium]HXL04097.1 RNA methyltransferase [Bacillota bacterium]
MKIEITITSRRNARILEARKLKRRPYREEKGRFLLEGIRGIEDALNTGARIYEVMASPYLFRNARGCALYERLVDAQIEVYGVTEEVLEYVADTDTPQGVVAIVRIPDTGLCLQGFPLILLADEIRDPGNLGTLIRSADAFGLAGVILSGDVVDPFNPKCVRATMGSILRVPLQSFKRVEDSVKFLKTHEFRIVASSAKAKTLCYDYDFRGRCGILVGSEAHGLTRDVLKLCDEAVRIPMIGDAESLNAGVAGSILMYEAYRKRQTD